MKLVKEIQQNPQEIKRRKWMLIKLAEEPNKHQKFFFLRNEYHANELAGDHMIQQKLDYMNQNPVVEWIVDESENYLDSSA